MIKLLYKYHFVDAFISSGTYMIPFEYSSKEEFIIFFNEKIKDIKKECIDEFGQINGIGWYQNGQISLGNFSLNVGSLDDFESNLYTLDEWFEKEKQNIV